MWGTGLAGGGGSGLWGFLFPEGPCAQIEGLGFWGFRVLGV